MSPTTGSGNPAASAHPTSGQSAAMPHAAPHRTRALPRLVSLFLLTCFALFVFAVALLATAPAQSLARAVSLPPQLERLSGGLWQGRAHLAGGLVADWSWRPSALLRAEIGLDLTLTGPQSLAEGRLAAGPGGRFAITELQGRLGPEVLALLGPANDLSCDSMLALHGAELAQGPGGASAGGRIAVGAGTCRRPGATPMQVPASTLTLGSEADRARAVLTADDAPDTPLASAALGADRLELRIEPEGAALVPGLPSGAPIMLEYPL